MEYLKNFFSFGKFVYIVAAYVLFWLLWHDWKPMLMWTILVAALVIADVTYLYIQERSRNRVSEGTTEAFMRNPQDDPRWADTTTEACWKEVKQNKASGRWSHCRFKAGHEGDCVDADGWLRDNH